MDENSCENETSESVDDQKAKKKENAPQLEVVGVTVGFGEKANSQKVSDRCGSSFDASGSGPSTHFSFLKSINNQTVGTKTAEEETTQETSADQQMLQPTAPTEENVEEPADFNEAPTVDTVELPTYQEPQEVEPLIQVAPEVSHQRKLSVGPPPSYSFVMKQKKKVKSVPSPDPLVINRLPPPTYSGSRGLYMSPDQRTCTLPSFAEPIWRSHSQPALCPRCGITVLTTTHAHDSIATHVAALALCLFGCWPCCLLPYCMNVCKNTYHHCPICQTFLGLYRPW